MFHVRGGRHDAAEIRNVRDAAYIVEVAVREQLLLEEHRIDRFRLSIQRKNGFVYVLVRRKVKDFARLAAKNLNRRPHHVRIEKHGTEYGAFRVFIVGRNAIEFRLRLAPCGQGCFLLCIKNIRTVAGKARRVSLKAT